MTQDERFEEFVARADDVRALLAQRSRQFQGVLDLQMDAARRASAVKKKVHWLRKGAETMGQGIQGMAACKPACDACCHVPVMLLSSEAKVIGLEIGVAPADVPHERRDASPPGWRGQGHACPFLRDASCSIRESRPMACRLLFNLDSDEFLCQHHEKPSQVPYLDTRPFHVGMALALDVPGDYVAELREFFPNGLDL